MSFKRSIEKLFFLSIFFFTLYRVTFFHSMFYISLVISFFYILYIIFLKNNSLDLSLFVVFILFASLYYFCFDVFFGLSIDSMSLSIRLLFLIFVSIIPAYMINRHYVKGESRRMADLVRCVLWIQLFFWIVTYISPDIKIALYNFIGASDSVNLLPHNMQSRGFGLSNEINFTSPSFSVLLSFIFLGGFNLISGLNLFTQLFNSNMVAIALFFSFVLANTKISVKLIFLVIIFLLFITFGFGYVPRLSDEIESGGLRTLEILFGEHFVFYNSGLLEWIFGAGEKVYGKDGGSDVGWVILVNFYGISAIFFALSFLWMLSKNSFSEKYKCILWFLLGCIFNTKGLIIGANAYVFVSFILIYHRSELKKRNLSNVS